MIFLQFAHWRNAPPVASFALESPFVLKVVDRTLRAWIESRGLTFEWHRWYIRESGRNSVSGGTPGSFARRFLKKQGSKLADRFLKAPPCECATGFLVACLAADPSKKSEKKYSS